MTTDDTLAPGAHVTTCPEPGCDSTLAGYGGRLEHHDDGSHTIHYDEPQTPNVGLRPTRDMLALAVTLGHAKQLTQAHGTPDEWDELTAALVAEHTPEQLANMLTGAAALIVRMSGSGSGKR